MRIAGHGWLYAGVHAPSTHFSNMNAGWLWGPHGCSRTVSLVWFVNVVTMSISIASAVRRTRYELRSVVMNGDMEDGGGSFVGGSPPDSSRDAVQAARASRHTAPRR